MICLELIGKLLGLNKSRNLDKLGLSYLWMEGNGPGNSQCLPEIIQRLKDQEIQKWGCLVRSSETLKEYSKVKGIFGEEYYFKFTF